MDLPDEFTASRQPDSHLVPVTVFLQICDGAELIRGYPVGLSGSAADLMEIIDERA
ncbi:hypothetical protein [Microvirga splendida]|uniref:Uncharacterized protein n=1 Tax=Microvirga splendida TaxID=2795727 RepID=A0ABS0Y274_9HYPH|nr:hypothetical protein [Microvirga splendida]MBJ6126003.1 hypothetical protein [Microvirga splendida]